MSTLAARRRKSRKLRVCAACLAGACTAVGYALMPQVWQIVTRILLAPLMVLAFDKYSGVKDYAVSLVIFTALTFALGGAVTGISNLIGADVRNYITLGITAFAALIGIILLRSVLFRKSRDARKTCEVEIDFKGRKITASALCDTGNALTDGVSGLPVMIVSSDMETKMMSCCEDEKMHAIEGFITVNTVSGDSSLPIVRLDEVRIADKRVCAYAAFSRKQFDGYDVILQNTMF